MTLSEHPMSSSKEMPLTENAPLPLAEEQDSQGRNPLWDAQLTQQLRVLLHTDRLLHLQHRDDYRTLEYQHYSSLSLAIKIFDLIIAHTGLGQDIELEQAMIELFPLLEAMDRAADIPPDRERHIRMIRRVFDALLNEDNGRQPFKLPYITFEQGNATRRVLAVRLLEERFHTDGRRVLRLSNESANLFLNALTTELEDAQAAAEAIIQSQLARGRVQQARVSAQWALQQSIRLREHLEHRIFDTRRNFQSVNWKEDMHQMINEALAHVRDRCVVENSIVTTAREQREQLTPGSEKGYQLAEIIALIEACRQQHLALQRRLMEAPRVFFEEQERQIFTFRPPPTFPHPQNDLLAPLLSVSRVQVMQTLDALFPACLPVSPPGVFSLARYLNYLLQPRREMHAESVPILQPDLMDANYDHPSFPPDILERGASFLTALEEPERLSHVIQQAQCAGETMPVIEAFVLQVLDYADRQDAQNPEGVPIDVLKVDDQQFWLKHIAGDDVVLMPREEKDAS